MHLNLRFFRGLTFTFFVCIESVTLLSLQDECSFVSLRDVDRALKVMMWFYSPEKELFDKMNEKAVDEIKETYRARAAVGDDDGEEGDDEEDDNGLVYRVDTYLLLIYFGSYYLL